MPSVQSLFFRLYLNYQKATNDWNAPVEKLRAQTEMSARFIKPPRDVTAEPIQAAGLPAEWLMPSGVGPDRTMFYLHGGGYAIGSCNSHRALAARLAKAAGIRALTLDYRLAPEHPYPAALDDALAAYHWLTQNGIQPKNVVIAGDSAGGGLALAVMLALRDGSEPLPAAAVCISPLTDAAATGESLVTNAKADPWLTSDGDVLVNLYVGDNDPRLPLISPLYADLDGLPPLLIHAGAVEIMLSDSTRLAEKARAAGVDVTLTVWEGMWHVFHMFAPYLPEARQAIGGIGAFVQERLE